MKAILFAEWLAVNHYRLISIYKKDNSLWVNENCEKTIDILYKEFEKEYSLKKK